MSDDRHQKQGRHRDIISLSLVTVGTAALVTLFLVPDFPDLLRQENQT